jgi:prepilin-type N-terminal cleavage/methylation domain-containing protein
MITIRKSNKGFTLIELLVVISIMSILGTIAVTTYIGTTLKAARSEAYSNLESLRMFNEQFFAENATYTNNIGNFPGFQPGAGAQFNYALILNQALVPPVAIPFNGASVAQANCFIATATAIPGMRVQGDIFAIDCNNNKNF